MNVENIKLTTQIKQIYNVVIIYRVKNIEKNYFKIRNLRLFNA